VRLSGDATVASFYRGWDEYQRLMAAAIAPLDAEQLGLSAAPQLWSIRQMVSHVVAVREWWFHQWMGEGGPEWEVYAGWDDLAETTTGTAAELVKGLEKTWSLLAPSLERWTAADLNAEFRRPRPNANGERPVHSRQWIIWHVAEHDVHHGGEISLTLGMHGLIRPDV
jgi:uncharacterized damage-inducible protein DinB